MFGSSKRLLVAFIVVLLTTGFAHARIGTLFEEGDASPSGYAYKLVVPNGTLSIVNGVATLTIAGAGTVTTSGTINVDEIAVMAGATSIKSLTEAEFKAAYNMQAGTDYQSVISFGANVETALGVAIGSAGAPVLYDGAGGTPSAITLTNGTGLPIATGVSGLGANVATFLVTPTLANLNSAVSDATLLDDGAIADSTAIGLTTGDNYTNFGVITDDSLNEMFAAIDTALGGLSGDVTGVGDCASGACLDGSSDGGTYIRLYDGDSNYSQLASGNVAANLTFTFPTAYPGAANAIVVMSTAGVMSTLAATTYQASDAQLDDIAALTVAQGDILYVNGSGDIVNLGAGTDGYFLKTQGAAANPVWAAPPGGGDITAVGACANGDCFVDGSTTSTSLTWEMTDNAYETVLTAAEPEQDNTITLPDQTGYILLGPASLAADNILVKTDGTESLMQATGITIDDSNNATGFAGITMSGNLSIGADPADAGAIRLSNATAIVWEDATEASITHIDNTGWLINSTHQLQFGDSGTHIAQLDDGHLDLTADIQIDLNGAVVGSGNITSGDSFIIGLADIEEAELEILDGATLSTTDINIIDGISDSGTLTATELLYVDGVTSSIQTQLDARCLESVFGTALEADDLTLNGTTLELVAEIPHIDAAQNISADWETQDDTAESIGNDNDWERVYDELTDDRLEYTHAAGPGADVYWDLNDNAAASTFTITNSDGTYTANLVVEGTISQGGALLSATYQPLHGYLTDIAAISSPTLGDLMYFDGTDWVAFAPGTNGYFLQSQGDGSALTWASGSSTGVNETYGSGWDADPSAPEKDDIYDYLHQIDADDDGSLIDESWFLLSNVGNIGANKTFDNTSYTFGMTNAVTASDQYTFTSTGAIGDVSVFNITHSTGNATDGTLLELVQTDTDIDPIDVKVGGSSVFNLNSSGVITLPAGGGIVVTPNATAAQYSDYYEDTDDGSNYHRIQGQAFAANRTSTLPDYNIGFLASTQVDSGGDLADGSVDPAHLADADFGIFTISSGVASLDANTVDSDAYVDGSIDPEHVASGAWDFGTSLEADTLTEGGVGVPNTGDNLSVFAATTSAQLYGVISDETGSGAGALAVFNSNPTLDGATITSTVAANLADTETVTIDGANDTETMVTMSLNIADIVGDTTALLITAVDNDDANYIPLLIQDDQDGTPDDLFKVDYAGAVTAAGAITSGGTVTSNGLFDVTGATGLDLGSTDVTDITLLGQSEDLAITPSADTWTVSSSTGVTDISFSAINISTTGVIKGRASYGADITGAIGHNTTATHGVFYHFTAAATVTLDAAADAGYGAQVCYRVRDAAEAAVIDVDAAEKINLAGTALAAGTAITATGAGESVCMVATTDTDGSGTDGWEAWGATSGWASE